VKYPIWLEADQTDEKIRPLAAFLEQMSLSGIHVVGTLDQPPNAILVRFDSARLPSAAEIFGEKPEVWSPSLQRTMVLVGTQVRWWQLGRDGDTSFCGYPDLEAKTAQVKKELDRAAYGLNLGLGWNWQHPVPTLAPPKTPWRFLSLTADPPLTADELATYLPTVPREQAARWVQLKLLGRHEYSLEDRATDLVRRVLAAKLQGAEAVFASEPFDADHGLMDSDGRPSDLFLPWRTTALTLGGAEALESMRLPQGSSAQVFLRDNDATMVAWNRRPTEEKLYLGEDARLVDLWGHEEPLAKSEAGHRLRLGPVPAFVIGLDKSIALWRHGCVLGSDRIPSVFNQRQTNRIEFRNTFDQPVTGTVTLHTSEPWGVRPDRFTFRLKPAEVFRQDLELTLPSNANSGLHVLRANFELTGDRACRFSAYRTIQVGLGDVRIDLTAHLNHKGELEVQQWTVNEGDKPVELRCQLFAPGRQRLTTQVVGLSRGQDLKVFRFPEGRDLVGKTLWLQAQETNGPQVLNYRFVAEP